MRCSWRAFAVATAAVTASMTWSSCSLVTGGDDEPSGGGGAGGGGGGGGDDTPSEVVLLTHSSFSLPEELIESFEADTGLRLDIRSGGDAGEVTNRLVLTKDDPAGDVVFGVDNAFASRALDEGVFQAADVAWPDGVDDYTLDGDDDRLLAPVDNGNVCVNVDTTWFEERDVPAPESLDDLVDPAYEGLFVTPSAATSSPGLAFLLATIAEYGDDWPAYWEDLMANDTAVASGWTDAYQVEFTAGGGEGDRPVVTSYDSSPAFTVPEPGAPSTTRALLDTCFLQVEYAGVLAGAANPEGGAQVVEWLLSPEVQAALPESMYVFPTAAGTDIPAEWSEHAQRPTEPLAVDPAEVAANRDDWLQTWNEIITR